jgi:ABC-2 type transport system ATP-binding protein
MEYFGNLRGGVDPAYRASLIERLDVDPSRRFKEYSKGNKQKIGLVIALQHRPDLLILDEPTSGLDPLVQQAFYALVREAQAEGRTVFLSSHLMSEMALTADRLIVIGRGRLLAQTSVDDFVGGGSGSFVRVRSTERDALARLLKAQGATVVAEGGDALRVTGTSGDAVGELARVNHLALQELSAHQVSLEERYMQLTSDAVDYRTAGGAFAPAPN